MWRGRGSTRKDFAMGDNDEATWRSATCAATEDAFNTTLSARQHGADRSALRRRVTRKILASRLPSAHRRYLTDQDEEPIQILVRERAEKNATFNLDELVVLVHATATRNSKVTPQSFPNRKWLNRFLRKYPDLRELVIPTRRKTLLAASSFPKCLARPSQQVSGMLSTSKTIKTTKTMEAMEATRTGLSEQVPSVRLANTTTEAMENRAEPSEKSFSAAGAKSDCVRALDKATALPVITCKCHVARCSRVGCWLCSRCGCSHNGISIGDKVHARRGRPVRKKLQFETIGAAVSDDDDYSESDKGELFVDDKDADETCLHPISYGSVVNPENHRRARGVSAVFFDTLLSPPPLVPTPTKRSLPSCKEIMRFFGETEDAIAFIDKKIVRKSARTSSNLWSLDAQITPYEERQRRVTMNMYMRLLTCIAESVCGPEAAAASIGMFSNWMEQRSVANEVHQTQNVEPAVHAMLATKYNSVERRTLRAVICASVPRTDLVRLTSSIPRFGISRGTYAKAIKEYSRLLAEGTLQTARWSREKVNVEHIDRAIKFILAADNVVYLSWGSKRIQLDGVFYEVPSILRKKTVALMFDQYQASLGGDKPLSRSTCYRLCSVLTHGAAQPRRAVDYVCGALVNDPMEILNRIVRSVLPGSADNIAENLLVLKGWLKYGSFSDVDVSSQHDSYKPTANCPRHQMNFGLANPRQGSNSKRLVICSACLGMRCLTSDIYQQLESSNTTAETLSVVNDCYHKFDLFMGHRLRVLNQQQMLHKLFERMKTHCINDAGAAVKEILLVIDFKMKAEPLYYRETTMKHFGKRGMTWHGAMARFWTLEPSGENGTKIPVENKVDFDHISACDNKQDRDAVVAFMEAAILAIKRDLPTVTNIIVQSDNASSYQNAFVAIVLPILAIAHDINISRYVHTETQDGKSMLDAHFAQGMRKVKTWIQQENDCYTPSHLVTALTADNGLLNCIAELVEYSRDSTASLRRQVTPLEKSFNQLTGRVNELIYVYHVTDSNRCDTQAVAEDLSTENLTQTNTMSTFSLKSSASFDVRAFSYTGIGKGTHVRVKPRTAECTVVSAGECFPNTTTDGHRDEEIDVDDYDNEDDGDVEVDDLDESSSEAENDVDGEIITPTSSDGVVTGVKLMTATQIRMRTRRWQNSLCRDNLLPSSRRTNSNHLERGLIPHAKRSLLDMKLAGDLAVIDASDVPLKMVKLGDKLANASPPPLELNQGWARRPPKGSTNGANYTPFYRLDIAERFERGVAGSSNKFGPGRMLEELQVKYPDRFNLPAIDQIRAEISKLMKATKHQQQDACGNDGDNTVAADSVRARKRRRNQMNFEYSSFLSQLVNATPTIKPLSAVALFREKFPDCTQDDVPDEQIRNKISSLKANAKRSRTLICIDSP